jgi:hypothetical protein
MHLEDQSAQYESSIREKDEMFSEANEAIQNYKDLNDDLCNKINELESE